MRNRPAGVWSGAIYTCILGRCKTSTRDFEPTHRGSASCQTEMVATQVKIAILGGDPIIGGSLEALLRAAGSEFREVLRDIVPSWTVVEIPVLELLPVNGEQIVWGEHVVPWPCSPERLKRAIDSALLGFRG